MKPKHLFSLILLLFLVMLFSCSDQQEQEENADTLSLTTIPADDVTSAGNNDQDVSVNQNNLLIGKWNYLTTINEMDGMEMKMKVCEKWIMEYRADGTFSETQTLDKDYSKDGKYTKNGNKVKREGLIEFEILEIDEKSMTFKAAGVKQVWERVK